MMMTKFRCLDVRSLEELCDNLPSGSYIVLRNLWILMTYEEYSKHTNLVLNYSDRGVSIDIRALDD